jgi:hypothetical protein
MSTGPKKCPECLRTGGCLDTRQRSGYIIRRYRCEKGHKWTTLETIVTSKPGTKAIESMMKSLRSEAIADVIAKLQEYQKE